MGRETRGTFRLEESRMKDPDDPTVTALWARYGAEGSAMGGMNDREEEEFLLLYGPKKVRRAIKERRAREQAQKRKAPN
jgi:hypothetical protein